MNKLLFWLYMIVLITIQYDNLREKHATMYLTSSEEEKLPPTQTKKCKPSANKCFWCVDTVCYCICKSTLEPTVRAYCVFRYLFCIYIFVFKSLAVIIILFFYVTLVRISEVLLEWMQVFCLILSSVEPYCVLPLHCASKFHNNSIAMFIL